MTNVSDLPSPSPEAISKFQECLLRIQPSMSAKRLWKFHLTSAERQHLGGDLACAYSRFRTAGMWAEVHGVSPERAVIEVANEIGFLRDNLRDWLLGEFGQSVDVEEAIEQAIAARDLVLDERTRSVHWLGDQVEIDFYQHGASWNFLWQLCRFGKARRPIDCFAFGENANRDSVAKHKSRLINMPEFPVDLAGLIEPIARGTQQLQLDPARIRIFEVVGLESVDEWTP